jgi:hypothetical protein
MDPLHDLLQDKFTDLPDVMFPPSTTTADDVSLDENTRTVSDAIFLPQSQVTSVVHIDIIRKKLYEIQTQVNELIRSIDAATQTTQSVDVSSDGMSLYTQPQVSSGMVIEGVFTGNKMMGADGKEYDISPNYASKSKLVEGDFLKLTITPQGKFFFKQIGPVKRATVVGEAWYDTELHQWFIIHEQYRYKLLLACATFYKIIPGQQVTILVPEGGGNTWTTIERI